jgi:cytochrome c-type biogenesis protein
VPAGRVTATQAVTREQPRLGRRPVLAAGAALLALAIAVGAALLSGGDVGGATIGLESIAARAQTLLQGVGTRLPLGYAFAAGMVAAVNPCGFSLLPAYIGLYVGDGRQAASRALVVSGAVTASFVVLFGAAGVLLSAATSAVVAWFPWASLGVGVLLVLAGGRMLAGGSFYTALPERLGDRLGPAAQSGVLRYFAYGLAFALCSLSCTLPIFMTVVGGVMTVRGFLPALAGFVLYGLGTALVLAVLTIAAAFFKSAFAPARRLTGWLEPASAILLLVTGAYVVYYWLTLGGLLAR